MAKPTTGYVFQARGRWYARIRVGEKRPAIGLDTCTTEEAARARCVVLVTVAAQLAAAGIAQELALDVLKKLGARADGKPLEDALRGIEAICSGAVARTSSSTSALSTVKELGEAWTGGDLARAYPDHIKSRRSGNEDSARLKKYVYKVVGPVPIASFTLDHAMLVLSKLPPELSHQSRRHVGLALNRLLNLAVFPLRLRETSPLPRGWLPKIVSYRKSECLFPDEETALMKADPKKVPLSARIFYGLIAREGFRASEGASLRWSDVDLERGFVSLDKNKTDDPRSWPMNPGTTRALIRWRELEGKPEADAYIFRDEEGKPIAHIFRSKIGGEEVDRLLCTVRADAYRDHLTAAGITRDRLFADDEVFEPTGLHQLRGLFVTTALANGRTESWVSIRTGHRSSQMIERYRKRAQNLTEATLRQSDLLPLDEAIPELTSTDKAQTTPPSGGAKAGQEVAKSASKEAVRALVPEPETPTKPGVGSSNLPGRATRPRAFTSGGYEPPSWAPLREQRRA